MLEGVILDKQLPTGFTDLFFEDAARQLWLCDALRALFAAWGYAPVIPPTVSYAESLAVELGAQMAQELYRFFDREGHTLALRADLTVPVARIVGTRLYDRPMPLRLSYVERVFRHIAPQAAQRREFTQAGVELVGADTPQADAEVVALAAESLRTIGVRHFRLTVGHMGFFRALMDGVGLPDARIRRLRRAIDRRNDRLLETELGALDVSPAMRDLLRSLPNLTGGHEVIDKARSLTDLGVARAALDRLEAVIDLLEAQDLGGVVLVDLGEVRGMEYYTGLVFRGYAAGVGLALCSGGRYDDLIGHFGPDLPAVGFAMDVELARLAVEPPVDLRPDLVVGGCTHRECHTAVRRLRRDGKRVIVDALGRQGADLIAYARSQGARAACCLEAGHWEIVDPDGTSREVTVGQVIAEAERW